MNIARSIIAVIVGYLIFALSAAALFQISGRPPHEAAPTWFVVASGVYGCAFALCGGYVAALLANRQPFAHGCAVAGVVALGATISLVSTLGHGAIWTQVTALALMAPCAALGGWLRARKSQMT